MEHTLDFSPAAQEAGPMELDVEHLDLVAGGLPRGNWLGTEALPASDTEYSLPRGNWAA